jgi:hypothetical protein
LLLQLNFFSSSGAGDLAQYIQHIGWMPWCWATHPCQL